MPRKIVSSTQPWASLSGGGLIQLKQSPRQPQLRLTATARPSCEQTTRTNVISCCSARWTVIRLHRPWPSRMAFCMLQPPLAAPHHHLFAVRRIYELLLYAHSARASMHKPRISGALSLLTKGRESCRRYSAQYHTTSVHWWIFEHTSERDHCRE